jgi:hypothetical protein
MIAKPTNGGPIVSIQSEKKPQFGDEFRAGNDLYVFRSGKWRHQGVLLPGGKLISNRKQKTP